MVEGEHTGLGSAALILGILGIIFIWLPFVSLAAIFLGILAIIFGALAYWGQNRRDTYGLAGFILGLITIILVIVVVILAAIVYVYVSNLVPPG
jgi:hypothetical protein